MKYLLLLLLLTSTAQAVENDKLLHATGSAAIAYGVSDTFKETEHPLIYPFALTMSLGLLKELAVDMEVDRNDLSADAIGAFIGVVAANQQYILPSWSATDKRLFQSFILMDTLDFIQTRECLSRVNCYEANPVFGKHPSNAKLITYKLLADGAIYWLADESVEYRTPMLVAVNIIRFVVDGLNYFELRF